MDLPIVPHVNVQHEQPPPPALDVQALQGQVSAPTAEQAAKADQVFRSRDADVIAGMMGMYSGMMLLRDLAREHLCHAEEEEEEDLHDEETDPSDPAR
jgi:hypothetical protein